MLCQKLKHLLFGKFISKNLVEIFQVNILDNMNNGKDLLAQELKILYPDVTDLELRQMTNNLVDFYTIATKVIMVDETENTKEFVVDDKNFSS